MKTYLYSYAGEVYGPAMKVNIRGYREEELQSLSIPENAKVICIEDEIQKYHLDKEANIMMSEECNAYRTWSDAYNDRYINGFHLPIKVKNNDEYRSKLRDTLDKYVEHLKRPAFVYKDGFCDSVETICQQVLHILDDLLQHNYLKAEETMKQMLTLFQQDDFLINNLDSSYAFRGIAPYPELHNNGQYDYEPMLKSPLTFFRARTIKKEETQKIDELTHMLHLPHSMRDKASDMRFNKAGVPGLYLGTTSYVCSKECGWNSCEEDLYVSAFVPNDQGKKLKILNLVISQALINGMGSRDNGGELQLSMLKVFPLVIATSFDVSEKGDKDQYLLSQLLMNTANQNGIDGIAYLSAKGEDEFQYPQGVNLAIPVTDISEQKQYSEKCKAFDVTKPVRYEGQEGKERKSYINTVYKQYYENGTVNFASKVDINGKLQFYGDTFYGKFDDFIVAQKQYKP